MKYDLTKEQRERVAKWCEALESGKYKQGRDALRNGDMFCCLGVACDLVDQSKWSDKHRYDGCDDYPPRDVAEMYGLRLENLRLTIDGVPKDADEHNDNGKAFTQIAKAIREQILGEVEHA